MEPSGKRSPSDAIFGALLFVVALLPRLFVAVFWAGEPVWDGHYYDFGARRIAQGLGYSDDLTLGGQLTWHPWCHYPVGYSAFLAVFYRLFGDGRAVAAVVDALVGAALAVVTWALARHALPPMRARAAGSARCWRTSAGPACRHQGGNNVLSMVVPYRRVCISNAIG